MTEYATLGPIALVGSGEYTPAMEETDRFLLAQVGRGPGRVAVIPTASGLEPGMPERWNSQGVAHFAALGCAVTAVPLVSRDDAHDPAVVAALEGADFYYFSGGNPEYLVETLRDTPAWEAIRRGHAGGAALAGCSAGAMMLGGATLRVRAVAAGQPPRWLPAMGVVPQVVLMPHFDRMSGFVGPEVFRTILASAPAGATLVGVDEDTALVGVGGVWQVLGRQTVSLVSAGGDRIIFAAGAQVPLG